MSDGRWTIIPPCLGWPLAVSLWFLPGSCKRAGASQCLGLAPLGGQVLHSADRSYGPVVGTFPSANESDRSWFVKLSLCKKVDLCVRERALGAFCPSHVRWKSLWPAEEAGKATVIQPRVIFFSCCCPVVKQEKTLDSVAAPMGTQLFLLVSWVCSFPLTCSPLYSCFAPSPRLK